MMMVGRGSTLVTLDEGATIIWEAADGSTPLEEIVDSKICTQFKVERDEALRDAEALVEGLAGHGLLLLSGEPPPLSHSPPQPPKRRSPSPQLTRTTSHL